jgi:hypothetical protein
MDRSVDEILADIDNATTDELARVADSMGDVTEPDAEKDDTAQADLAPSSDAKAVIVDDADKEAVILARDGKSTIPYSALEGARAAKSAAEAAAKAESSARVAAEAKVAELEAMLRNTPAMPSAELKEFSQEELAALEDDFPNQATAIRAMQSELAQQRHIIAEAERSRQSAQQADLAKDVQDLIDANPKLVHIQSSNPAAWAKMIEIDNALSQSMPNMAERFSAVVGAYEASHGVIAVKNSTPAAKSQGIHEVLASIKPPIPNSLSDLPGGSAVESADTELANLSVMEVSERMGSMTPAQLEKYLNNL